MKTCGIFSTHRVEIECELGKPITFIPFGDIHRDSDMFCHVYWERFLERAKKAAKRENAVFLGMGDYTDGVSTSERIVLSSPGLHDTTKVTLKDHYKGVAKTLVNELDFMRGRLIGLLGGNHYFDFGDGDTTDHVLAAQLGTKFLGVCSLIRLSFRFRNKAKSRTSLDIFAHHGRGGGSLPGSQYNTLEKMMAGADADFYLMGHTHAKGCIPSSPRLKLTSTNKDAELVVRDRIPWLGRTGSFLKAYEPGRVSYNVDAGRPPAALGWIEFEITPRRVSGKNGDHITFDIRGTA